MTRHSARRSATSRHAAAVGPTRQRRAGGASRRTVPPARAHPPQRRGARRHIARRVSLPRREDAHRGSGRRLGAGADAEPTITLITCYPFSFVGNAPQRFIVQAELVEEELARIRRSRARSFGRNETRPFSLTRVSTGLPRVVHAGRHRPAGHSRAGAVGRAGAIVSRSTSFSSSDRSALLLILERALRLAQVEAAWIRPLGISVLLAHPYLLLRVVSHFRPDLATRCSGAAAGSPLSLAATWTAEPGHSAPP